MKKDEPRLFIAPIDIEEDDIVAYNPLLPVEARVVTITRRGATK